MTTVTTIVDETRAFLNTSLNNANSALSQMNLAINNVGYDIIGYNGANLPQAPELPELLVAPTFEPVDLTIPAEPGAAPEFQAISSIDLGIFPEFTTAAPALTIPTLPSQLGEFNVSAPAINTAFTFPDAPAALDLEILAPTLAEHDTPERPTISLPSFDAVAPSNIADGPNDLDAQYVAAYRDLSPQFVSSMEERMDAALVRFNPRYHTQLTAIETQLSTYLAGGTGLSSAVETAIYERAKGKDLAEARRMSRAAIEDAAARGFTIPDGAAMSGIRKSRQAASDNLARSANEIAIKQAEMEQQNLQFAVTTSTGLRTAMLSAALSYHSNLVNLNGQALQAARDILGMVVQTYNITLDVFKVRQSAYQAEAAVYDTRLKAALSLRDLYESDIKALQALTDVDQSKVAIYRAKISAQESLASVYKTRVDAIVSEAGLEKLKLDLYKTQAEGFAVQAQIKEFEYKAFQALMSGNEQLVRVYSTQLDAHNSRLKGIEIKANVQTEVIRAQVMSNDGISNQYKSQLDTFRTIVEARAKVATTEMDSRRQYFDAWVAQSRTAIANAELGVTVYRTQGEIILQNAKLELEALYKSADNKRQYLETIAQVGTNGAQQYTTVAGGLAAGLNTLVAHTLAE